MLKALKSRSAEYSLVSLLKDSSGKQVYKAYKIDPKTGIKMPVLLKIFPKNDSDYQLEVDSLLRCRSHYCVKLLGFEQFKQGPALILEYIEGISLEKLIQTASLSEKEKQFLISSIYEGLLSLKKENLCHGDLSLNNILVDREGLIRFIDFGKANYEQASCGTMPFVAPEILEGSRANFLSDLFSLGVIHAFLDDPDKFHILKSMQPKDFISSDKALLAADPSLRSFDNYQSVDQPKSFAEKVNRLIESSQSQSYETKKLFSAQNTNASPRSWIIRIACLGFLSWYAGASHISVNKALVPKGVLQIITNQWTFIELKNHKSYAPFHLSLAGGWHILKWKTADNKGVKLIYIRAGKSMLLSDEDFN